MKRTYKHLTEAERELIVIMVNRNESVREIARTLIRSPGTICREVKRNHGRERYRAHLAQKRAIERHHNTHKRKRLKTYALQMEVESMIMNGWSPELIAGRIRKEAILPTISHEAIYQWIYSDADYLIGYLVRSHQTRWPKGKSKCSKRTRIPNRVSITERPDFINNRKQPGHWETDLVVGPGKSALQVTVERKTRFTRIVKIIDKTASSSMSALFSALSPLPKNILQSITYDNGSENVQHSILNNSLGTSSFFCNPYHSWEKGTVENTNGLIRRSLPKRTNFDTIPDADILKVESWLNNRPRKCLGFSTPNEVFNSHCCT